MNRSMENRLKRLEAHNDKGVDHWRKLVDRIAREGRPIYAQEPIQSNFEEGSEEDAAFWRGELDRITAERLEVMGAPNAVGLT